MSTITSSSPFLTRPLSTVPLFLLVLLLAAAGASAGTEAGAGEEAAGEPAAAEAHYTVLLAGNEAGTQVIRREDGGIHTLFEYNDRGRGPRVETRVVLGEDGLPERIESTGHDYLKRPVEERFVRQGRRAHWQSSAEEGEAELTGPAFYLGLHSPPASLAILIRALAASPEGELPLLPEGEARLEKVAERTLEGGGGKRTVTLYAVSGLGFTATSVWVDEEGAFFAAASRWLSVVRAGWEKELETLLQAEDEAEQARYSRWARKLAHRPQGPVAFRNARVYDAREAAVRPGWTVVIAGERITAAGPDGEVELPAGAQVIDAEGKTLLPGLWDLHVHVGDLDGLLHLAAGVTSVRDLANDVEEVARLGRRWETGEAIGPRLTAAGFMDGPGPYAGPTKVLVDTPEEARAAIDRYAELGYPQIKVYSSIKPELVPEIVRHAHGKGMRVSGHVPAFMTARRAVELGFDEIQHVNMLFLNFWPDEVPDTRTPARFTEVAKRAAELDLTAKEVQSFIALLKEKQVVVDPTVNVFEGMFLARPGEPDPGSREVLHRLPPQVQRRFLGGGLPVPEGMDGRYRESFQALLAMVKALYDAGVPLVAGTDALAGFSLHRELELYVQAGVPAPRVLQIATLGAARVVGRQEELGTLEAGKLADLVLVDGNPTADIRQIRNVELTVKNGVLYRPAELYRQIGVTP